MDIKNFLTKMSEASACEAVNICREELSKYGETRVDNLGSVIMRGQGAANRRQEKDNVKSILLDAHIDKIGMMVSSVDITGFVRMVPVGGVDIRVLAAAEVTVYGKMPLPGVITSTPPHLETESGTAKGFDSIGVDIGLPFETAKELVRPGDRIEFKGCAKELLNGRLAGPGLDNAAGIAVILRSLELLSLNSQLSTLNSVSVCFSNLEETGGGGAGAAAFAEKPDISIAVDVSYASAPDVEKENRGTLGGGVMIGISPVLSREISDRFIALAEDNGIKYTHEVMGRRTGTNADLIALSRKGVKTGLLSVPLRNMHTAAEIIDPQDIEAAAELLAVYLMQK
ncbi:MAG: M28 family peptidase [Oscillospiraceae bacterium]|nr:M28 family peptidase [Oscillospiraceae bacterium]